MRATPRFVSFPQKRGTSCFSIDFSINKYRTILNKAHLLRNKILAVVTTASKLQNLSEKKVILQFNSCSPSAPWLSGQRTTMSSEENGYKWKWLCLSPHALPLFCCKLLSFDELVINVEKRELFALHDRLQASAVVCPVSFSHLQESLFSSREGKILNHKKRNSHNRQRTEL